MKTPQKWVTNDNVNFLPRWAGARHHFRHCARDESGKRTTCQGSIVCCISWWGAVYSFKGSMDWEIAGALCLSLWVEDLVKEKKLPSGMSKGHSGCHCGCCCCCCCCCCCSYFCELPDIWIFDNFWVGRFGSFDLPFSVLFCVLSLGFWMLHQGFPKLEQPTSPGPEVILGFHSCDKNLRITMYDRSDDEFVTCWDRWVGALNLRTTPRYCGVCGPCGEFMCFATVVTAKTTGRTWYPLPNGENSVAERPDLPMWWVNELIWAQCHADVRWRTSLCGKHLWERKRRCVAGLPGGVPDEMLRD